MAYKENCLICGAPLEYLAMDENMTCALCGKQEQSKTRCTAGHYVCNECHTQGMDNLLALCLQHTGRDPMALLQQMMAQPWCHMHGPEQCRWHAGFGSGAGRDAAPRAAGAGRCLRFLGCLRCRLEHRYVRLHRYRCHAAE